MAKTQTFLQWKGTDVCLDFYCKCGNTFHLDEYFAYYIKCLACGRVYKMPDDPKPQEVQESEHMHPVFGDQEVVNG
jgi:hypothetical protein